jgi:ketosteroid isomerase-like protein
MMSRVSLLAAALAVVMTPAFAAEDATAPLRAVFEAHEKAFNAHDLDGVMGLWAPGAASVAMGTGPGERWVGSAAIRDAYQHFFADFDAGTLKRHCTWELPGVSGNVGWVNATCDYEDQLKDAKRSYSLNISVVLQNLGGHWKLRAMHASNLVAPTAQAGETK